MSLSAQFRKFNARASAFRQELFGTDAQGVAVQIDYNRGEHVVAGYYSPIRNSIRTEEAGFIEVLAGTVRIPKPISFIPERNKPILIKEVTLGAEVRRIELVIMDIGGSHPASAEWVLNCEAANS